MSSLTLQPAQPLYPLRAQFSGTLTFLCPFCGVITKTRINPTTYTLSCLNVPSCGRQFYGPGLRLAIQGKGPTKPQPLDTFLPGELFIYRTAHKRFHSTIDDEDDCPQPELPA